MLHNKMFYILSPLVTFDVLSVIMKYYFGHQNTIKMHSEKTSWDCNPRECYNEYRCVHVNETIINPGFFWHHGRSGRPNDWEVELTLESDFWRDYAD